MRIDSIIFSSALLCYGFAVVFYLSNLLSDREWLGRGWVISVFTGFLIHSFEMMRQATALIQSSSINLFQVIVLFSWALVGLTLVLQSRIRMRLIVGIILVIVLGLGAVALGLPKYFDKDIPSFNAFWFGSHILLALLGYASFLIALVCGILYLVLDRQLKRKISSPLFYRLPPLDSLEKVNFRSLWAGAILLGLALVSGVLWARWSNSKLRISDPKVLAAYTTWICYAVIIYIRARTKWRGRKVAYLTVLGFGGVVITFIIMNYVSKGHGFF